MRSLFDLFAHACFPNRIPRSLARDLIRPVRLRRFFGGNRALPAGIRRCRCLNPLRTSSSHTVPRCRQRQLGDLDHPPTTKLESQESTSIRHQASKDTAAMANLQADLLRRKNPPTRFYSSSSRPIISFPQPSRTSSSNTVCLSMARPCQPSEIPPCSSRSLQHLL